LPSAAKWPKIHIEYVPISKLKKWKPNPRIISDFEREALQKNISKFGFVDPRFCDVTVTRWEQCTGKKATLAS